MSNEQGTVASVRPTDATHQPPIVVVNDLVVRYGAVEAVRGISLEVPDGVPVAVVGPNGAGKTSLLRTLSGFVRPSQGSVYLDGDDISRRAPYRIARAGLVHVPEGRGIIAPLSVHENLLMGAYSVARDRATERIEEMVALFPALGRRMKVAAGLLSGGEQQMLAIARGLMSDPKVLVIDEPSMGLAPVVVDDVFDGLVRAIESGVSLLLAEQNVRLALDLAEQIYVLVNGTIVFSGARSEVPEDLLETYVEGGG